MVSRVCSSCTSLSTRPSIERINFAIASSSIFQTVHQSLPPTSPCRFVTVDLDQDHGNIIPPPRLVREGDKALPPLRQGVFRGQQSVTDFRVVQHVIQAIGTQ